MAHLFPSTQAPMLMQTPTPQSVLTPTESPVGSAPAKGSASPTFLGSSVVPAAGAPGTGGQKKLLGQ